MKNEIKLYRVITNILFFIFYSLLASIAFSFVFPTILIAFWQEVWLASDPRFANIQIWIIILVLILTLTLRKYFYLPITIKTNIKKAEIKNSYTKSIKKKKSIEKKLKETKKEKIKDSWLLDIKIGKEIK